MKRVIWLVLALGLFFASSPALAETPVRGGSLIVCQNAEPPGLDPTINVAAAIDRVVWSNIIETLVGVDGEGKYGPCLAESWEISPDGKVYLFHLQKGVKYHNGEPFNAEVAKWNLDRARAEKTTNSNPTYFRGIETTEALDERTLKVTLKEPDALFIPHMAEGDASMLPMKAYQEVKAHPIGTGPFRFVKWVKGDRIEMERFKDYWNAELPYLDQVTFRFIPDASAQVAALKAGDIDVVLQVADAQSARQLVEDKRFKVHNGTTNTEVILATNNKAKPFDNLKVRQAVAHAIDRQMIIDLAMSGFGTPIGSFWPPATPYYVDLTGTYPYDPEKAKKLLAEAGFPNGFDAVLKVVPRYPYTVRCGQVIADLFGKVGIRLKLENIEWGQWLQRIYKNKEYQLTIIGHTEAYDISAFANPNYYFQYDSERFREAFAKALKAPNEAEKAKWFGECQRIIAQDAACGYLFSQASLPVMKSNVEGWWYNYLVPAAPCAKVWLKK